MPFINKSALFAGLFLVTTIACGGSGSSESREGHFPGASTSQFAASCGNGIKDNGETATDCGGPNCGACGTGAKCLVAGDCLSLVCKVGYCAAPGVDGVQNGDESDVDCGGTWPSSAATAKCAIGKHCFSTNNCVAGAACVNFTCAPPSCSDGIKNGTETDIDCGGSCPNKCIDGKKCSSPSDCVGNLCSPSSPGGQPYCRDPNSCADGQQDNDETGVDCGGSCKPCGNGIACTLNIECASGNCGYTGKAIGPKQCLAPTCSDGIKNGTETGVDCGGSCAPCGESGFCNANTDCAGGLVCTNHICQVADASNLCLPRGTGVSYTPGVVCSPPSGCTAGACNPLVGSCASVNLPDGTTCTASDPNASSASCSAGTCAPTACATGYTLNGSSCDANAVLTSGPLRTFPSATALADGGVLVAGGQDDQSGAFLDVAEVYNPSTGVPTNVGAMVVPRISHKGVRLSGGATDGQVLIVGGFDPSYSMVGPAELFDPSTGNFTATGTLNYGRVSGTVTVLASGKVLVAGGLYGGGGTARAEIYDPATGLFTEISPMGQGRDLLTGTLLNNGLVLLVGGAPNATAELFDPSTNSFRSTGSSISPSGRYAGTATLLADGRVLIAGGYSARWTVDPSLPGAFFPNCEIYDPSTESFTDVGPLQVQRYVHYAALRPDGKVVIAGGENNFGGPEQSVEIFDPGAGSSTLTTPLASPRVYDAAAILPGGHLFIVGGDDGNGTMLATPQLY